jgi:hypothetical protein
MHAYLSVVLTWLVVVVVAACSLYGAGDGYDFRILEDLRLVVHMSKVDVPELSEQFFRTAAAGDGGVFYARFRGSLIQLFGPPLSESTASDEAFLYIIEARSTVGQTVILTAYGGPSGPAIGGDHIHPLTQSAAAALFRRIEATPPADFAATVYNADTDQTVIYGCTAGSCYWHETAGNHLDE